MHETPLKGEVQLVVGCWPGRSFAWNSFARIFSDSLEAAGCHVIDVEDPRRLSTTIDVLHIHWPDQLFWGGTPNHRAAYRIWSTLRALRRLRRRGVRIVWMVHNLRPHELDGPRAMLWRWLSGGIARLADGFMTLSPATLPEVRSAFPGLRGKPAAQAWHPAYPRLAGLRDRASCRAVLGVGPGEVLVAFLGLIRPYKGVDALIAAFRSKAPPQARLLIAGDCETPSVVEEIRSLVAGDDRITLSFGRLSETAFAEHLVAADAVALPYRRYLHSGSIIHALSYARPVITPAAPFADALADLFGTQWVRTYENGRFPANAFDGLPPDGTSLDIRMLDPANIGAEARRLYLQLLQPREANCPSEERRLPT